MIVRFVALIVVVCLCCAVVCLCCDVLCNGCGVEQVTQAYDGSECVDRMLECPRDELFDLIVMDFEMPVT